MSFSYNYHGKVVLITGSSSGIGAATAVQFAKSGASVVVTGRDSKRVSEVAKQCLDVSTDGLEALEVLADVTRDEDLQRLVDTTIETFGKIDILVNNVGIAYPIAFDDHNYTSGYRDIMKANFDSVVVLTHICVKHLEKTKGNIINISSIRSDLVGPKQSAYSISKSALDKFTKCIALELAPKGIRVNSVKPGNTRTNQMPSVWDKFAKLYPLGRNGLTSDVSHAVMFLAAGESSFMTGTTLVTDGGYLANQ